MAEIANVVSGEPVESSWGNAIRDRTVQRYVDATARAASVGFPQAGMLSWLDNPGQLDLYDGTDWVRVLELTANGSALLPTGGVTIGTEDADLFVSFRHWRGVLGQYMQAWNTAAGAVFRFFDGSTPWDYYFGSRDTQPNGGTGLELNQASASIPDGSVLMTTHNDGARRFQWRTGGAFLLELWSRSNTGTWLKVMDARNDNGDLRVGNAPRDGSQVRNVAHSSTDAPPAGSQPGDLFLVYE
jgi:hypothetical protein